MPSNGEGNVDLAFNLGSDARIDGRTVLANPFKPGTVEGLYWQKGWEDVNRHWGKWASWPIKRLPSVGVEP